MKSHNGFHDIGIFACRHTTSSHSVASPCSQNRRVTWRWIGCRKGILEGVESARGVLDAITGSDNPRLHILLIFDLLYGTLRRSQKQSPTLPGDLGTVFPQACQECTQGPHMRLDSKTGLARHRPVGRPSFCRTLENRMQHGRQDQDLFFDFLAKEGTTIVSLVTSTSTGNRAKGGHCLRNAFRSEGERSAAHSREYASLQIVKPPDPAGPCRPPAFPGDALQRKGVHAALAQTPVKNSTWMPGHPCRQTYWLLRKITSP